jgi:DNA-binding transcriptional ArsR family regulator
VPSEPVSTEGSAPGPEPEPAGAAESKAAGQAAGQAAGEPAAGPAADIVDVRTDQQLHAVGSLARHRVLRVLRDGPATVTQIAERLGIAKGSSHYHVKVLAKAGLVHVVETRKVRGVVEQYYGMVARGISLPDPGPGEPEHLMRHALADVEAAPPSEQKTVWLKHVRLSPAAWEAFDARITVLMDELAAMSDPAEAAADFFVAFYRPLDTRQLTSGPAPSAPNSRSVSPADAADTADTDNRGNQK